MRILLAPDSFKGALSARGVAEAMRIGIRKALTGAEIFIQPMADGGEGTLDAILEKAGKRFSMSVPGVDGLPALADYGSVAYRDEPETIILEAAQVVGWGNRAAAATTIWERQTAGLGEMVQKIAVKGHRTFLVGLGGTSTNDCGVGFLHALGVRFLNSKGNIIAPTLSAMESLSKVDISHLDTRILECQFEVMNDVDNPLTGNNGATAVFGPQKGIPSKDIPRIDRIISKTANVLEKAFERSVQNVPGAGAAGGLGFAFYLLGGTARQGAHVVADIVNLERLIANVDWIITGEGSTDIQTCYGKAPAIISQLAAGHRTPVTILSGNVDLCSRDNLAAMFSGGCFSIVPGPITVGDAMRSTEKLVATASYELARLKVV